MEFNINPYVGVGPIKFGMSRDEIHKVLSIPFESFMKTLDSIVPTDDFRSLNLHVYYNENFKCRAIEFFKGANITFKGHEIAGRPFSEVMEWLTRLDPSVKLDEDSGVNSEKLGITLWIPDSDEDENSLIETVYVFTKKE